MLFFSISHAPLRQNFDILVIPVDTARDLRVGERLARRADGRARIRLQHGLIAHDFESGIPAIEALIEKIPNDVSVQRLAGRIYLESGDDDKALEAFETVNRLYWQVNPQTKQLRLRVLVLVRCAD